MINNNSAKSVSIRKNIIFFLMTVIFYFLILFVFICISSIYFSDRLYGHIKCNDSKTSNKLYIDDPELGFGNIQESRSPGFARKPHASMRFEEYGSWIPVGPKASSPARPLILVFGCSYTYGIYCSAEETYPYLLGKYLNGTSLNAGLNASGLSHMLLLARRLIPKYKPDYVIFQYSPWLTRRATMPFVNSGIGKIPTPYFTDNADGSVFLHDPVYKTKFFRIPQKYRESPSCITDYLSFIVKVGLPLYIHEHFNVLFYRIKRITGIIPPPTDQHTKIVKLVYNEIDKLSKNNGAKLFVVLIGGFNTLKSQQFPAEELLIINKIKNITVIDTTKPLFEKLPDKSYETYAKKYFHWSGNPPVMVDYHFNYKAHDIIAKEIMKTIKKHEKKIRGK